MEKKILLINDICGYGKVALSAMIPVLSYMGVQVYNLPTAIVSNTLNYGKFKIQDTSDYIKDTLKVWEELNFSFEAISTGFIVGKEQMEIISDFCKKQSEKGVHIFSDPIMGDNGKLYDGIPIETIDYMKKLISVSDISMPNYTEACFLTGKEVKQNISKKEIKDIIDKLRNLGAKSVVITSSVIDDSKTVAGYDDKLSKYFYINYEEIPVYFPGTGDIFSSVLIGSVMQKDELETATKKAMKIVKQMIKQNISQQDNYKGLPIERCIHLLDNIYIL